MSARVDDELVTKAAEALVAAADSLTNAQGLKIHNKLKFPEARSAVLGAIVAQSLGYPHSLLPTGWQEITMDIGGIK